MFVINLDFENWGLYLTFDVKLVVSSKFHKFNFPSFEVKDVKLGVKLINLNLF